MALNASSSGAAQDVSLTVCQANPTGGALPYILSCRSNAENLHERRGLTVPDVPPECKTANPSATDIDRTYREGIIPYTVASFFNLARVNPAALRALMKQVPNPNAMLCPQIRRSN